MWIDHAEWYTLSVQPQDVDKCQSWYGVELFESWIKFLIVDVSPSQ